MDWKDLIFVASFLFGGLSFLASIAFSVFGKPRTTQDLESKLQDLIVVITRSNSNIETLQKEIKAMWTKIDFLMECSIKHDREIAYIKGKRNINEDMMD